MRPYLLLEANYGQLLEDRPNVAVLPWGATEAHNYHLPHGADTIEATSFAGRAAELACRRGAKPIVLPAVPFGNNAQQLDQAATIHLTTATAAALLNDVAGSLRRQGIDRLLILNAHGGNDFKPLVRDARLEHGTLIVVVDFWRVCPDQRSRIFDNPGDHADEMETSLIMHLEPDLVAMDRAGEGRELPMDIAELNQPGVWAPRPWSRMHPDTGCGDPSKATAEKGARYFEIVSEAIADVLVALSKAEKGDVPYV